MNLNHLNIFIKIAKLGSLTKAAQSLAIPKSQVSRVLLQLESEMGALVLRNSRELKLTELGKKLFDSCDNSMQQISEAIQEIKNPGVQIEGLLRITAPFDLGVEILPRLISSFLIEHPKLKFDILFSQENIDLVKEGIDVAIRAGKLSDSSLKATKLSKGSFIFVCNQKFAGQRNIGKDIHEVNSLPIFLLSPMARKGFTVGDGQTQLHLKPEAYITANDPSFLLKIVQQQNGLAFVPENICQQLFKEGVLEHVFKAWKSDNIPIHAVHPYKNEIPKRVRAFIDHLSKHAF